VSDDLDRLYDLRDEVDREQQRLSVDATTSATVEATDDSAAVTVVFGSTGHRLTVTVAESWRDAYEPEQLGAAIVKVATQAASDRLLAWGTAAQDRPRPRARPLPSLSDTGVGRLAAALESGDIGRSPAAVTERIVAMLSELNRGLDETFALVRRRAEETFTARSADGHVEVEVDQSGLLRRVDVSLEWLQNARAHVIGADVTAAIVAAQAQRGDESSANPLAGTPLEKFAALATDPDALVRMIREEGS